MVRPAEGSAHVALRRLGRLRGLVSFRRRVRLGGLGRFRGLAPVASLAPRRRLLHGDGDDATRHGERDGAFLGQALRAGGADRLGAVEPGARQGLDHLPAEQLDQKSVQHSETTSWASAM